MKLKHYKLRLAPQPQPEDKMWKIIEDDVEIEQYAENIIVETTSYTEASNESYPDRFGRLKKWYIVCDGIGRWKGKTFLITKD